MTKTILVTGGNRGIGYEAVKLLSTKLPDSKILLASRSEQNGQDAIKKMRESTDNHSFDNIDIVALDVCSKSSIDNAVNLVKSKYGQLDVLINNSGISNVNGDGDSPEIFEVNVRGVKENTEAFLPVMSKNGTIIVVSSEVGPWYLDSMPEAGRSVLNKPTEWEQVEEYIQDWIKFSRQEDAKVAWTPIDGMMTHAYCTSKAILNAWARWFASNHSEIKFVLVCPGYCATDLNHNSGPRPASKGGESITWPVFNDAETGKFYQDGKELKWVFPMPKEYGQ